MTKESATKIRISNGVKNFWKSYKKIIIFGIIIFVVSFLIGYLIMPYV